MVVYQSYNITVGNRETNIRETNILFSYHLPQLQDWLWCLILPVDLYTRLKILLLARAIGLALGQARARRKGIMYKTTRLLK